MNDELRKCQYRCPKCGSVEADSFRQDGNEAKGTLEVSFWCLDCGCQYVEIHDLIYRGSYVELEGK